jgi:hypothetical protein
MAVEGVPAFNAVAVLQIEEIDYRAGIHPALVAHAAFINTQTGRTYGSTTCRNWSQETLDLLGELRLAMERDVARMVFQPEDVAAPSKTRFSVGDTVINGLGEHLEDPPSI